MFRGSSISNNKNVWCAICAIYCCMTNSSSNDLHLTSPAISLSNYDVFAVRSSGTNSSGICKKKINDNNNNNKIIMILTMIISWWWWWGGGGWWWWKISCDILQTTFSNAFSHVVIWVYWNLFLMVKLTLGHHWCWLWLGAKQAKSNHLSQ